MTGVGCSHFASIFLYKNCPIFGVLRFLPQFHRLSGWGQVGVPDVVPILQGEFCSWCATGKAVHGTDSRTFALSPLRAKYSSSFAGASFRHPER